MRDARLRHCARALPTWVAHYLSNTWGILNVFDLVWLRPMPGGLVESSHPFSTGLSPETGEPIWRSNRLFATEPTSSEFESDELILGKTIDYVRTMFAQSTATRAAPKGRTAPMPPAINLLHGPVHYNGVTLLFNEPREAARHFSDRRFVRELRRFIDREKREIMVVFREREYDPDDLALFTCLARTVLPYWANPNGNKRRMHWGVPSPYPLVNIITGNWIRETRMLLSESGRANVARPPMPSGSYFEQGPYDGGWEDYLLPERLLAGFTSWRVKIRKQQGGVYFISVADRKAGLRFDPHDLPTLSDRLRAKIRRRPPQPAVVDPVPKPAAESRPVRQAAVRHLP